MEYGKFYRYLLPFWKRELAILVLGFLSMALGLVNPYLAKLIIDQAYGNKDLKMLILLFAIGVIVFVLSGLFNSFNNYLNRYIKLRLNFGLNRKIFNKLQNLSSGFFQNSSSGEHLYRITYDAERTSRFIVDIFPQVITQVKSLIVFDHGVGKHRKCAELGIAEIIFEIIAEPGYNTYVYVKKVHPLTSCR